MIKLSANLSKKVPIAGVRFSSKQFGAAVEIECGDATKAEVIQARIRQLYQMLSASIDEQIKAHAPKEAEGQAKPNPSNEGARGNGNGNGNGNSNGHRHNGNGQAGPRASQAQQRAIFAICKSLDLDMAHVLADFNVAESAELHIKDASRLIDELKAKQNGNGASKRR